jgi:hypothetical protein
VGFDHAPGESVGFDAAEVAGGKLLAVDNLAAAMDGDGEDGKGVHWDLLIVVGVGGFHEHIFPRLAPLVNPISHNLGNL